MLLCRLLLSHTFQGKCTDPNDFVDDTPQQPSQTNGCPASRTVCNADGTTSMSSDVDFIHNFMDYR